MNTEKSLSHYIKIRAITIDDFETVLNWSKDHTFCSANSWESDRSPDALYRWWYHFVHNIAEDFIRMGIECDGRLIGYADLAGIKGSTAELGIAIGESGLWGQGIGTDAAKCMLDFAAEKLGITTFDAETHEKNVRSRRMLGKLGFVEKSRIGSEEYLGKESGLIQFRKCCD